MRSSPSRFSLSPSSTAYNPYFLRSSPVKRPTHRLKVPSSRKENFDTINQWPFRARTTISQSGGGAVHGSPEIIETVYTVPRHESSLKMLFVHYHIMIIAGGSSWRGLDPHQAGHEIHRSGKGQVICLSNFHFFIEFRRKPLSLPFFFFLQTKSILHERVFE